MSTSFSTLTDTVPVSTMPTELTHAPFLGFSVQRMDFFKVKECWTVLLTAETAEFFHWLSEKKCFVIPRCQAAPNIHLLGHQVSDFMLVKRPSEHLYFFKISTANAEMLRDWMGVDTTQSKSSALISNLYKLIYQPVPHLPYGS